MLLPIPSLLLACSTSVDPPPADLPFATAHAAFHTQLDYHGPSPQEFDPLVAPAGAHLVPYTSGSLSLVALMSDRPPGTSAEPAVLFLHGGFALDREDWQMAEPYVAAGYRVMMPLLRGEDGNPGEYSMFFGEVDDVVAAADVLAQQPGVDPAHVYVAGHSVGGTLAMLAAMATDRFRAGVSFSGAPDMVAWATARRGIIPFRWSPEEVAIRSPLVYATSIRSPFRVFHGSAEAWAEPGSKRLAERARAAGRDVDVQTFPGDHFTAVPAETAASLEFFQSRK